MDVAERGWVQTHPNQMHMDDLLTPQKLFPPRKQLSTWELTLVSGVVEMAVVDPNHLDVLHNFESRI